ncbi:MAG: acylphosphatase [Candidatus Auribacterota bacterium]|jgi:acylphosphatase|nr:acylphosphatase [Candidatus Auribacterota bacterium]
MTEKKQRSQVIVFYQGRVQGVGFRYSVMEIAQNFDVTGYVRNLHDGRVELCAEGNDAVLVDFLHAVEFSHLKRYITDKNADWSISSGQFDRFSIRY